MTRLSKTDLDNFKEAIWKDYGLKLEGQALYEAAFNLLEFFKALIKFNDNKPDKEKGRFESRPRQPI